MNSKWYISTLLVLLSLIGLISGQQTKVVNQKIVLQFSDSDTTSGTAQDDALATITSKLQALGITDIEVLENTDAQLSLRYYSSIDAHQVKEFLSNSDELLLNLEELDKLPVDFPEDELPEMCSLVVLDLHEIEDGLNFNGKYAFKSHKDDYELLKFPIAAGNITSYVGQNYAYYVLYEFNNGVAISIDNITNIFPEVRAGPLA